MKLLNPPWKTAWYDDNISERFFSEMSRMEQGTVSELETSSQWMNHFVIELGQLAQTMNQLDRDAPHASQIRLAFEKSVRISCLAAHLAAALDRANPDLQHTPVGPRGTRPEPPVGGNVRQFPGDPPKAASGEGTNGDISHAMPLRQTVTGLSRRGLSVAEIEVITGQSRSQINSVLNGR